MSQAWPRLQGSMRMTISFSFRVSSRLSKEDPELGYDCCALQRPTHQCDHNVQKAIIIHWSGRTRTEPTIVKRGVMGRIQCLLREDHDLKRKILVQLAHRIPGLTSGSADDNRHYY